jgi:ATP-binding protein involved in chromosome partitioning
MVKDVAINGNDVSFTVVLTTPACPMKDMIMNACINAIKLLVNKEANVTVNFTSNTSTNRLDPKTILGGVKNIIAIVSGKGGVGKSTVSANLALAIAESGAKVGLMDADIYGPSQHIMFGIRGERPLMKENGGKGLIVPIEKFGIKVMSIGLLIDEKQAVVWRGPMVSSAIRQFVSDVDWGELDYLILDLPPGTGDIHLSIVQSLPITGVVVVSTPQAVALADAKKGVAMFTSDSIKVPVLGIIENMAYFTPEELPENKYYIFGKEGAKNLAEDLNVSFLGEVPIVQSIREAGDYGRPAALQEGSLIEKVFQEITRNVVQEVVKRNENLPATEAVKITTMAGCSAVKK